LNLPAEIIEEYVHKHGDKTVMVHNASNRFTSTAQNRTLYEVDSEVTKVVGFLLKLIMGVMAGAGKKYAQDQLNMFKAFAERETTTNDKKSSNPSKTQLRKP
jgi:hypothetical protein